MGLLDYYRQFEDVDERELNKAKRERRQQEKAVALAQVQEIDLSGTEWPDLPNSEVMNAVDLRGARARERLPDRHATRVRAALAERLAVEPERIVLGNGAAELLQAAAMALLSEGDELAMPWPSYPALPADGRARGREAGGGREPGPAGRGDRRAHPGDRALQPQRPDGRVLALVGAGRAAARPLARCPRAARRGAVHFQDVEELNACLRLTDEHPNLTVFRTFSKIYGLSGLRAGYAVGGSTELLDAIAPVLGVNALTQAAVEPGAEDRRAGGRAPARRR